jgi:hypothetical protein
MAGARASCPAAMSGYRQVSVQFRQRDRLLSTAGLKAGATGGLRPVPPEA